MKFMMGFSWSPDPQRRAEGIDCFKRQGTKLPDGVRLLGRWTRDLLETEDPSRLAEFAYQWSDLMELHITPVLEDAELAAALQRAMG